MAEETFYKCDFCQRQAEIIMRFGKHRGAIHQVVCKEHFEQHKRGNCGYVVEGLPLMVLEKEE